MGGGLVAGSPAPLSVRAMRVRSPLASLAWRPPSPLAGRALRFASGGGYVQRYSKIFRMMEPLLPSANYYSIIPNIFKYTTQKAMFAGALIATPRTPRLVFFMVLGLRLL